MSKIPPRPVQLPLFKLCGTCHVRPLCHRGQYPADCVACAKVRYHAYYLRNKERILAATAKWVAAHAEEQRAYRATWASEHAEQRRARHQAWYQQRKTTSAEDMRQHRQRYYKQRHAQQPHIYHAYSRKYAQEHREQRRENHRKWVQAHPHESRAHGHAWRARAKQNGGRFTAADIRALEVQQQGQCHYCTQPYGNYHIDHKHPLSRGGSNGPENLCLTCEHCNVTKHSKTEREFRALLAATS